MKFGPDGYLYIGVGDGGSSNDPNETGQFLGDLLASILRIDVHGKHSAKSYAIPPGNPFINTPGALPEIWAYGLRQPWRFSFDRQTGELWVGDVGQDLWESVYRVHAGGNYGWSINEEDRSLFALIGSNGPEPIEPPVIAHGHGEARSITGGFVYRGARPKRNSLRLAIHADYETGKIWGRATTAKSSRAAPGNWPTRGCTSRFRRGQQRRTLSVDSCRRPDLSPGAGAQDARHQPDIPAPSERDRTLHVR